MKVWGREQSLRVDILGRNAETHVGGWRLEVGGVGLGACHALHMRVQK